MITVLIADDEALVRSGIRLIVEAQDDMKVVGEASDGADAALMVREQSPDVVLMDVTMPVADGIEGTRRIFASGASTKVLMLTTFDRDAYLYEAMKLGASGYLLKSSPPEQLVNAIRVIAAGESLLAPSITRRLIEDFVRRPPPGTKVVPELERLTEREVQVLTLIGRGLSNSEIADRLYLSEGTVKSHVNRVFTKLSLRDRAQAVVTAYETGIVRPGDSAE